MNDMVQYINPPGRFLKSKLFTGHQDAPPIDPRLIRAAEAKVERLRAEYQEWARETLVKMQDALDAMIARPSDGPLQLSRLFVLALDLKGLSGTFGYPLATSVAGSLMTFLRGHTTVDRRDSEVVGKHIEALRAIFRDELRADVDEISRQLLLDLKTLTDRARSARNSHQTLESDAI